MAVCHLRVARKEKPLLRIPTMILIAAAMAVPALAQAEPAAPPSSAPPAEAIAYVMRQAAPIGPLDRPPGVAEAAALDTILARARVIAFGESNHGNQEPLQYRNRLIRYLVEKRGLTAVALESGLAESRDLHDYVLGKPGDAATLVKAGLTHGFGNLRENLELVEWLRAHNQRTADRKVRLYGIDHSTILSGPGASGSGVLLPHVMDYLERTVPSPSKEVRAGLAKFADRFTENSYPSLAANERVELDRLLQESEALFRVHKAEMIRNTSADEFDWAQREAHDAARLPAIFAVWNVDGSDLEKLIQVLELRDRAMADHTEWVLRREGKDARVLLFQTNGHVTAAPMVGSVMRSFSRQPKLTGILLRERLGNDYRVIATVSSRGRSADDPGAGSMDRAFAAAGKSPVLLDIRSAKPADWWGRGQSALQGDNRVDDMVPSAAFDGLVYFDRLTPVTPLSPR